MKLNTILLFILITFGSCKDVEKNPSNCDYDTVKKGNMCTSITYLAELDSKDSARILEDAFLIRYFYYDEDYRQYKLITDTFLSEMNSGNIIENYIIFLKSMLVRKKTLSAQLKKLEDHGYGHYNESDDKYNTYALDSLIEVMSVLHGTEPLSLLILNDEFIEDEAVELETFVSHLNLLALPTFEGADNFIQFFYDEQRSLKLQANPNYERRKVKQLIQKDVNSLPECEAYKGYEEACYRMYQENLRRILPDVYHYLSPF